MPKLKIAVLFGGRSGEHEVSRNSGAAISNALSVSCEVFPIGVAKDGQWYGPIPLPEITAFEPQNHPEKKVTILPFPHSRGVIYSLPNLDKIEEVDAFFPAIHGTFGEDGTLQGFLELSQVAYVGSGVLASAAGMDKVIMKRIFSDAGLPQVPYLSFLRKEVDSEPDKIIKLIKKELGFPCFIKPANMGSSVGISKATDEEDLRQGLSKAAEYDRKIIVEKGINAREIEISVLGNENPQVSLPGEIIPCNEFYDYKAKYVDDRSSLRIPADLTSNQIKKIQEYGTIAYEAIDAAGLARIDFFIDKDNNEILINEINTLPGFTVISMYAKLWQHSGLNMEELTKKLVDYALERNAESRRNKTVYAD